jgi:transcriptional regulator with XRE-family HTH domain
VLLRDALGDTLRDARTRQNRTLRDVSTAANVSLGYLSEVERGRKEASSELLASICDALDVELSDVLTTVSRAIQTGAAKHEVGSAKAGTQGTASTVSTVSTGNATAGVRRVAAASLKPQLRIVVPYDRRPVSGVGS